MLYKHRRFDENGLNHDTLSKRQQRPKPHGGFRRSYSTPINDLYVTLPSLSSVMFCGVLLGFIIGGALLSGVYLTLLRFCLPSRPHDRYSPASKLQIRRTPPSWSTYHPFWSALHFPLCVRLPYTSSSRIVRGSPRNGSCEVRSSQFDLVHVVLGKLCI